MKKKVFGIVAAVAVVAIAGVNYLQMNQDVEMSDLALANVEALAQTETIKPGYGHVDYSWTGGTSGGMQKVCWGTGIITCP